MVLPLLELPEALQQHFAEQVPDAMTAGRLAQASQASSGALDHESLASSLLETGQISPLAGSFATVCLSVCLHNACDPVLRQS